MPKQAFSHVRYWVFDLDNTLYPPSARLFDQIEVLMTDFVMDAAGVDRDQANHLRDHYWEEYGTTLSGLMHEHDTDPGPYLDYVHNISLDHLTVDPDLRAHISALPGRKIIYTNGPSIHAERVSDARGLNGVFDAIYGIEHASFAPKPQQRAFEAIFAKDGVHAPAAAMFEDEARNLKAPFEMGMKTVLVGAPLEAPHIQFQTADLTSFLSKLVG